MKNGYVETIDILECMCGKSLLNDPVLTYDYSYATCLNSFQFLKCECGSYTLKNRPIDNELQSIYPTSYDAYKPSSRYLVQLVRSVNFKRKVKLIGRFTKINSWLDYGCGAGEFPELLTRYGIQSVYAIDNNADVSQKLESLGVFFAETVDDQIIGEHSIDVVSLLQVIEHLPDPEKIIAALSEKIKEGGILLIETPSPSGFDFAIGENGTWGGWHAPRHFFIFSKESLVDMLKRSGFEILKTNFIPSPYLWAETLKARRIVQKKNKMADMLSIRNPIFILLIASIDILRICVRKPTSNQRIIARKL
jgi:2-polyprenyl-3-methyl-5-hydroxy-6-metoxy-1,4-benzoquinol methylase